MINQIMNGDALEILKTLPSQSINCCVTSPPYYNLRNYGIDGQIGLENTPEEYIEKLIEIFNEVKRVLRDDGTLWINIADSYCSTAPGTKRTEIQINSVRGEGAKQARAVKRSGTPQGMKPKDLMGIPWTLAFALRDIGWYLRQDIIWHKPNVMPESVKDRCTKCHEYIFLLSKSKKYYYDHEAIVEPCASNKGNSKSFRGGGVYTNNQSFNNSMPAERETHGNKPNARYGGKKYTEYPEVFYRTKSGNLYEPKPYRNKRSVWTVATRGIKEAHFATFPPDLIEPCILAGCPTNGTVLDPFFGAGTTGIVAIKNGRNFIGIDLNKEYCELAEKRIYPYTGR